MTVTTISANQLQPLGVTTKPNPSSGQVIVPFQVDFTGASNSTILDLTFQQLGATFNDPRTLFFDNTNNNEPVTVTVGQTEQSFTIPPNSAGYFPLAAQPQSRITFFSVGGASMVCQAFLANYDIPPVVWSGTGTPVVISGTAAVSIADGADIALGHKADAAVVNPATAATAISILKGLLTELLASVNHYGSGLRTAVGGNAIGANITNTATLNGTAGKTTYLRSLQVFFNGATAGSVVNLTIAGLLSGTFIVPVTVPAGATVVGAPIVLSFGDDGLPASAINTPITVSLAALGAGNLTASVNAQGYQQ